MKLPTSPADPSPKPGDAHFEQTPIGRPFGPGDVIRTSQGTRAVFITPTCLLTAFGDTYSHFRTVSPVHYVGTVAIDYPFTDIAQLKRDYALGRFTEHFDAFTSPMEKAYLDILEAKEQNQQALANMQARQASEIATERKKNYTHGIECALSILETHLKSERPGVPPIQ